MQSVSNSNIAQENTSATDEMSDLTGSVMSKLGDVLKEATGQAAAAETQVVTNDSLMAMEDVNALIADMAGIKLPGEIANSFI